VARSARSTSRALYVLVAACVLGVGATGASSHGDRGSDLLLVWFAWLCYGTAAVAALWFAVAARRFDAIPSSHGPVQASVAPAETPPVEPVRARNVWPRGAIETSLTAAGRDERLRVVADEWSPRMIDFAQRLVRTPSLSGDEGAAAALVADEMRTLGYDEVSVDRVGNVVGVLRGTGTGASVQFNGHLDVVSPGDPALWSRPPYEGVIEGDVLYGRGASDVKGAFAAQVYLVPVLRQAGIQPSGDVLVVGVVLEEVGGFGSQTLAREQPTTYAVLAEATNNQLRRGHRGRALVKVTFTGASVHASAPERGHNPHFAAARFLLRLESLAMAVDPTFGRSSVAPTLVETDQVSGNVTPGTVSLFLDWRSIPEETPAWILDRLEPLLRAVEAETPGILATAAIVGRPVTTYTGVTAEMPATPGFQTALEDPLLTTAQRSLEAALGRPVEIGTWTFATDGGQLMEQGIKTIGFAPGEERFAHTIEDQISLSKMREALVGNAVLALDLTALTTEERPR
jgi:putative selenium metabolism hydrolase